MDKDRNKRVRARRSLRRSTLAAQAMSLHDCPGVFTREWLDHEPPSEVLADYLKYKNVSSLPIASSRKSSAGDSSHNAERKRRTATPHEQHHYSKSPKPEGFVIDSIMGHDVLDVAARYANQGRRVLLLVARQDSHPMGPRALDGTVEASLYRRTNYASEPSLASLNLVGNTEENGAVPKQRTESSRSETSEQQVVSGAENGTTRTLLTTGVRLMRAGEQRRHDTGGNEIIQQQQLSIPCTTKNAKEPYELLSDPSHAFSVASVALPKTSVCASRRPNTIHKKQRESFERALFQACCCPNLLEGQQDQAIQQPAYDNLILTLLGTGSNQKVTVETFADIMVTLLPCMPPNIAMTVVSRDSKDPDVEQFVSALKNSPE